MLKTLALASILSLSLGATICGVKIPDPPPATPTPVPTVSTTPTPTATATPEASPSPTPTVEPSPSPSPTIVVCSLSVSDGKCEDRPTSVPQFRDIVTQAQNMAAIDGYVHESGKVRNELEYTRAVIANIRKLGYCSDSKLADEVWVKDSNTFSEHYDIVTGDGYIWNHYAARCAPAKF